MAKVVGESRTLGTPAWMKDFGGRESILPVPARLDPTQFSDGAAVLVKLNGAASAGTDEEQTVTVDATGGTFTLTFEGQTTAAIPEGSTAAAVEAALEALSNVPENGVEVTGAAGGPWTVKFRGTLGKANRTQMTADATSLTGGAGTAIVATTVPGVAPATALSVDALTGNGTPLIPSGTVLDFGGSLVARTSADVNAGAVSIPINLISGDIADNSEARYSKFGGKYLPSGLILGRTFAERDSNTPYGLAVVADDEIYFNVFELTDALENPDCELYRHGRVVAENHLPQVTRDYLNANASLLAKVRGLYVMINAEA